MSIFKKTEKESCCKVTATKIVNGAENQNKGAKIKILGSGCKKCNDLEENTRLALGELGLKEEIEHVSDFGEIASYGVMTTPALVVGKKVLSVGKVLSVNDIAEKLKTYLEV